MSIIKVLSKNFPLFALKNIQTNDHLWPVSYNSSQSIWICTQELSINFIKTKQYKYVTYFTVWKLQNFSGTQILREIKGG